VKNPQVPMIKKRLRLSAMLKLVRLLPSLYLFIATHAMAATPCDFKGVFVGDKTTPPTLIKAFGIMNYKMNPERPPFDKTLKLGKKYSLIAAAEIEDWNMGSVCDANSCRIPFGVGVGNSNLPVSVFISFPEGRITEIDVTFNQLYWGEIRSILDNKYGAAWRVERDPYFLITDKETKQSFTVERTTLTHRINGTNPKTGDTCQIWATNYDMVFTHHDPLGTYHSVFAIKLTSRNF